MNRGSKSRRSNYIVFLIGVLLGAFLEHFSSLAKADPLVGNVNVLSKPPAEQALIEDLKSSDFTTRLRAAKKIGELKLAAAVPFLDAAIEGESALILEGAHLQRPAREPLCGNDESYTPARRLELTILLSQSAMVDALVEIGPPANDSLLLALSKYHDASLIEKIIAVQATVRDARSIPLLLHFVQEQRFSALTPLAAIGDKSEVPPLWKLFLRERDPEKKVLIAKTIDSLGGPDTSPELQKLLAAGIRRPSTVQFVGHELLQRKHQPSLQTLRALCRSPNPYVQLAALGLLGSAKDESLIPLFLDYAKHKDPSLRKASLEAISKFDRATAVPLLIPLLQSSFADVREIALIFYSQTSDSMEVKSWVAKLQSDQDERVRDTARSIRRKKTAAWGPVQDNEAG